MPYILLNCAKFHKFKTGNIVIVLYFMNEGPILQNQYFLLK